MQVQSHLRNTFLAGIFAAVPLAVTAFIIFKVDEWTRVTLFGKSIPFVGVVLAILGIYLMGLIVTVSIGKMAIRTVDAILSNIPLLKPLYLAWKQIALTPGGGEGMFAKVVLIPDEAGHLRMLGFTSGQAVPSDPNTICVFVPGAPNPIQGRLFFVQREKIQFLPISAEEAFKALLSNGNYVPEGVAISGVKQNQIPKMQVE